MQTKRGKRIKDKKVTKPITPVEVTMNPQDIEKVESYVKTLIDDSIATINAIITTKNPQRSDKSCKFVTIVEIQHKVTGLKASQNFNSLKILRELKQKDKYSKKETDV